MTSLEVCESRGALSSVEVSKLPGPLFSCRARLVSVSDGVLASLLLRSLLGGCATELFVIWMFDWDSLSDCAPDPADVDFEFRVSEAQENLRNITV